MVEWDVGLVCAKDLGLEVESSCGAVLLRLFSLLGRRKGMTAKSCGR